MEASEDYFHAAKGGKKDSEQGILPGRAGSVWGPQTSPGYLRLALTAFRVSGYTGEHSYSYTLAHTEGEKPASVSQLPDP